MTKKQMALAKKVFAIGAIVMMLGGTIAGAMLSLMSY
jgi:hypothetical protein